MARKTTARKTRGKRRTKASKQRSTLWNEARHGPFQTRDVMNEVFTSSNGNSWLRCSHGKFQPSNSGSVRIVLDAQHARARTFGLQTASQFGYGIYDVDVELVPSNAAINPEDSRLAHGEVNIRWIEPTPLRMDALKHLKSLERMEDSIQPFTRDEGSSPEANPLLASALDDPSVMTDEGSRPLKGSRIIRFGWKNDSPMVYRQSAITVDLNTDGDTSDQYETQYYVLDTDDPEHFALMPRMESAVNPVGPEGTRLVDMTWAYPMSSTQVVGTSSLRRTVTFAVNPKFENGLGTNLPGGIHQKVASFRGIRCIGGLMELTIPEFFTAAIGATEVPPVVVPGTANNDFELVVNLRCRKWIPQE